jgi:hypothetical protein
MQTFNTEEGFAAAIEQALQPGAPPEAVRGAIVAGVRRAEEEVRAEGGGGSGLELRIRNWVLREEDLPVAETIGLVGAAATALLAPAAVAAAAVVTALTAFAGLCWRTWRKGGVLSRAEIAILGFLQVQGPMTLDDLKQKASAAIAGLTPDDVGQGLQSLRDVELRDGRIVELVRQDASGRWRAHSF